MWLKDIFPIILVFFIIIGCIGCVNQSTQSTTEKKYTTDTITPKVTIKEITQSEYIKDSISVSYDNLFRNNEQYIGKKVHFQGKIIQMISYGNNYYLFRIAVFDAKYPNSVVLVWYTGQRFLEEDVVEFWGIVNGIEDYETIFGQQVSVPSINAKYLGFPGSVQDSMIIQPTPTQTKKPIEVFYYTNPSFNYSIPYPTSWTVNSVKDQNGKEYYVEFLPPSINGMPSKNRLSIECKIASITDQPTSHKVMTMDVVNAFDRVINTITKMENIRIRSTACIEDQIGNNPACSIYYWTQDNYGNDVTFVEIWVTIANGNEYIITSESENSVSLRYFVDNFRFT